MLNIKSITNNIIIKNELKQITFTINQIFIKRKVITGKSSETYRQVFKP